MSTTSLPELEANFDAILDLLDVGIFVSNRQGVTLRVNKAYEALTGMERKKLEGMRVLDLQDQGVFNRVLNPIIVNTGKPVSTVQEFGKERRTLHLQGFPIFDARGKVCLVVTFARDVTAIAQLQRQIDEQARVIAQYQDRMATIVDTQNRHVEGVFASAPMQALLDSMLHVAATDATVLLLGETGTGKDVMAWTIHANSPRKDAPFIKVDCSSISNQLTESELFGYVKGAFTGANAQGKAGYFETADGGTIFLDEIGERPLSMQACLLRVLQDQEIVRVGSSRAQKIDVRVIAATNRNLSTGIVEGNFRQDLYYRLDVAKIIMPPLRERQEDIPLLTKHFLKKYNAKYKKSLRFSPTALRAFSCYAWPGNIRELQNIVQHVVITQDSGIIEPHQLPGRLCQGFAEQEQATMPDLLHQSLHILPNTPTPLKKIMATIEYDLLTKAVEVYGSYSNAADMLQINRSTLFRKLRLQQDEEDE